MDYRETALQILQGIGGEENVVNLEHCSTRLRFTVADKGRVDVEALQKTKGVLQVIINSQVQVVIGNAVIEVYDELLKVGSFGKGKENGAAAPEEKKSLGNLVLEYLVGIFQPLIPAIAGAGILKSILILLLTLGLLTKDHDIYKIFISISNATFYFMPMMVAITTATKLNTNKLVALAAVGVLLLPDMGKMTLLPST